MLFDALRQRHGSAALGAIDRLALGCVTQVGEESANIARTALLGAGWPVTIPGLTIDRDALALPGISPDWISAEGGLRLRPDFWPDLGGMDGFYIAALRLP